MLSCGIYKIFKNTLFEVCKGLLLKPVFSPGLPYLHFWLNLIYIPQFWIIIYSFVCQYSLRYYWYYYNQKQWSRAVLQKRCSYKFCKIHKKTRKKRFRNRCFLVNFAKFLITVCNFQSMQNPLEPNRLFSKKFLLYHLVYYIT